MKALIINVKVGGMGSRMAGWCTYVYQVSNILDHTSIHLVFVNNSVFLSYENYLCYIHECFTVTHG